MLEERSDYEFLTENALKRVDIKGEPYPVRKQKLVITGEDEAYLRDAMLERRFLKGESPGKYNEAILRITKNVLQAKWLYDQISAIVSGGGSDLYGTWIDKDDAENFEEALPKGAAISIKGELTHDRPEGVNEAIDEYIDTAYDIRTEYGKNAKEAFDDLCKKIEKAYDGLDELTSNAEEERDEAVEDAQKSLESDLSDMESDHDKAIERIEKEYRSAQEDPDKDQSEAHKKYEEDLLNENNDYAMNVAERRDEARLAKAKAENDCRKTVMDEELRLLKDLKEKYDGYAEKIMELVDARDEALDKAEEERNSTIEKLEKGKLYSGYLVYDSGGGDGIAYSNIMLDIDEARRRMTISRLCLGKYLRKTPQMTNRITYDPDRNKQSESLFIAHAPSSDAVMRAYADLERMRCRSVIPPAVYRCAGSTETEQGVESYYVEMLYSEYGHYPFYVGNGEIERTSITYSDTKFAFYYGRKEELPLIDAIYVTAMVWRYESATKVTTKEDDSGHTTWEETTTNNITAGFLRIRLDKGSIQCESDLKEIDEIREKLAEDTADLAKERDDDYKAVDDKYDEECGKAQKTYDEAVESAEKKLVEDKNAAHREFMSTMNAAERHFNTAAADVESDDDMTDDEKTADIKNLRKQYQSTLSSASETERKAVEAAEKAYRDSVEAARKTMNDAIAKEKAERNRKKEGIDKNYQDDLNDLNEEAEADIAEIKKRPSEKRREAGKTYDTTVSNAYEKQEALIEKASKTYREDIEKAEKERDDALDAAQENLQRAGEAAKATYDAAIAAAQDEADIRRAEEAYNRAITQALAAYNQKTEEAYGAYNDASARAIEKYSQATEQASNAYINARDAAIKAYWEAYSSIEEIREDARCKWTFDATPVDTKALKRPEGRYSSYSGVVKVDRILHFDVVYTPKSLTGADFSAYYKELE